MSGARPSTEAAVARHRQIQGEYRKPPIRRIAGGDERRVGGRSSERIPRIGSSVAIVASWEGGAAAPRSGDGGGRRNRDAMDLLPAEGPSSMGARRQGFRSLKLATVAMDEPLAEKPVGVDYGVLDNGLTYYVRCNPKPRMRAALALAVKVG